MYDLFDSTADEYILRHFANFFSSQGDDGALVRVFDVDRSISTVSETVRKYCLLSQDNSRFAAPTQRDILRRKLVITTLVTSLSLVELGIKGHFSHIFIDEAAQVSLLVCVFLSSVVEFFMVFF